jgi:hypothetical protein
MNEAVMCTAEELERLEAYRQIAIEMIQDGRNNIISGHKVVVELLMMKEPS